MLVTRPRERAGELAARLRAQGHDVVVCPLVETEPIGPPRVDVAGYSWVIVTSRTGAEELTRRASGPLPRVAAIGPGTAAALRSAGVEPALVARESTQEGLLAALPPTPGRVLFAGAEDARPLLATELDAEVVPLYRTVSLRPTELPQADLVVLASPSAAEALAALDARMPAVTIGPQTTDAARAHRVDVVAEATTHDLDGLVAAVAEATARLRSRGS